MNEIVESIISAGIKACNCFDDGGELSSIEILMDDNTLHCFVFMNSGNGTRSITYSHCPANAEAFSCDIKDKEIDADEYGYIIARMNQIRESCEYDNDAYDLIVKEAAFELDNKETNDFLVSKGFIDKEDVMPVKAEPPVHEDKVNHPKHYTWLKKKCGIEVIDITRHMTFNLGNVVKYVLRSGHKGEEGYTIEDKEIEDLEKAAFCLKDEIKRLRNERENNLVEH